MSRIEGVRGLLASANLSRPLQNFFEKCIGYLFIATDILLQLQISVMPGYNLMQVLLDGRLRD